MNGGTEPVYVNIKGFILKASELDSIEISNNVGLSALQRDML